MAHFFNPRNPEENYNLVDLHMKPGQSKPTALWGGGPGGADLDILISKSGIVSRSAPKNYPQIDHTRVFDLKAIKKGSVRIYGMYGGNRWAQMNVYVSPRDPEIHDPPPRRAQKTAWTCWAAALESYLAGMGTPIPQAELQKNYATDLSNGALEPTYQRAKDYLQKQGRGYLGDDFAKTHNLEYALKALGFKHEVRGGGTLKADYFFSKLRASDLLWICINRGSFSHCVVAYGVTESGEAPTEDVLFVMDPNSDRGEYDEWEMALFHRLSNVIIAWQ